MGVLGRGCVFSVCPWAGCARAGCACRPQSLFVGLLLGSSRSPTVVPKSSATPPQKTGFPKRGQYTNKRVAHPKKSFPFLKNSAAATVNRKIALACAVGSAACLVNGTRILHTLDFLRACKNSSAINEVLVCTYPNDCVFVPHEEQAQCTRTPNLSFVRSATRTGTSLTLLRTFTGSFLLTSPTASGPSRGSVVVWLCLTT